MEYSIKNFKNKSQFNKFKNDLLDCGFDFKEINKTIVIPNEIVNKVYAIYLDNTK